MGVPPNVCVHVSDPWGILLFAHFEEPTMFKHWLVTFVLSCAATSMVMAADIPADLAKAVKEYDEAQIQGDGPALRRLVADDYTLIHSTGVLWGKAELIADYTTPGNKIEPFTILEPIEKVWRDGAVMGGVVTLKGFEGGKPFTATLRFADVWAKRDGKWQVVYTHVSRPPTK